MKSPTFIAYVSKDHFAICLKVLLVNAITQFPTQLLANPHRTNSDFPMTKVQWILCCSSIILT